MTKTQIDDEQIDSIFTLHRSIIALIFKDFDEAYAHKLPEGLNLTHFKAIMTLNFHKNLTMTSLSQMINLEKGSFSTVAARLIKKGIMRKDQSCDDKRVYHLNLTDKGIELAGNFKKDHWDYISSILLRLSAEEQDEYFNLIKRLNELNGKMGKGSARE